MPAQDDGSRNDPLAGQNIMSCNHYQHDFDALRAASTRVVTAVAAESSTMIAGRAAVAVAERPGATPVTFRGGRDGFPGGEYGRTGDPDACAATLRQVLTSRSSPPLRRSPAPSARSSRTAAGEGRDTAKCANRPDRTTGATGASGFHYRMGFVHSASSATEMGLGAQSRRYGRRPGSGLVSSGRPGLAVLRAVALGTRRWHTKPQGYDAPNVGMVLSASLVAVI